mgnify:CR=1 FL=1
MLDMTVYKGANFKHTGMLDSKPFFKPTSLGVYLREDSAHTPGTLRSWPCGEVRRLAASSTNAKVLQEARVRQERRFEQFYMSSSLLDKVRGTQPLKHVSPLAQAAVECNQQQQQFVAPVLTLVLPWHPVLHRGRLGKKLQSVLDAWRAPLSSVFGRDASFKLRLAWKKAGKPLHVLYDLCD